MSNIADKLNYLNDTKKAIKTSIKNRGVDVSDDDTFRSYADKIDNIGETVDKIKFGMSIDSLIGDVDENGVYSSSNEDIILNLNNVTEVAADSFNCSFYNNKRLISVNAPDLINVNYNAFDNAFYNAINCVNFNFDSITEINNYNAFRYSFYSGSMPLKRIISFKNLKKISGNNIFLYAFDCVYRECYPVIDEIFPSVEEISGDNVMSRFMYNSSHYKNTFSCLKKLTGSSSKIYSTFGNFYGGKWYFPNAIEFTGYIWNHSTSSTGEIHFAKKNQSMIEACDGYVDKWGFSGATIYFDLILSIKIDGVIYNRDWVNSIHNKGMTLYIAWKDESNNIIYTDANTEPAIGTIVYSDKGITEFGTVSEVE